MSTNAILGAVTSLYPGGVLFWAFRSGNIFTGRGDANRSEQPVIFYFFVVCWFALFIGLLAGSIAS